MSDRQTFALHQRLSRLETPAEARVCGETCPSAHNSTADLYMLTCTKPSHGETVQHENRRGDRWPEVVQRRIDLVPEARR